MTNVYICPECGLVYRNVQKGHKCSDCNVLTVDTGFSESDWYALPRVQREEKKAGITELRREKERQQELAKQSFAKSFDEFYEYDVVTVVNKLNGVVDAEQMKSVLSSYAAKGWKLHTMYSNELGKNALMILGLGINSTACQDVMIFERRVQNIE